MNKRLKTSIKCLRAECRGMTGALRKLPDFLIIGTQKGGTSSLFYLFHPQVPERVRRDKPDVKIIALLRDPVERAFSHYRTNVKDGTEPLSFEEALANEQLRIGDDVEQMDVDERYTGKGYRRYSYIARGFYHEHLKRWLKHFPGEQLLVLRSEEIFAKPAPVVQRVFKFLGLDTDAHIEYDGKNEGRPGNIRRETRARLKAIFALNNMNLSVIAGPDFRWDDDLLRVPAAG